MKVPCYIICTQLAALGANLAYTELGKCEFYEWILGNENQKPLGLSI